jgi:hypothetical protein
MLERPAKGKHSIFLATFIGYKENKVLWIRHHLWRIVNFFLFHQNAALSSYAFHRLVQYVKEHLMTTKGQCYKTFFPSLLTTRPNKYCVQPFEWNNDVCQTTLLQSMIYEKVCHAFLCVTEKEGKSYHWRDREREWVRGRASEGREVG